MSVYRIDRFELATAAREELLAAVLHTHELLRRQPGFEHDLLVEEQLPDGRLHLLTLCAWRDEESVRGARAAIEADRATTGFDPRELMTRLGVAPEFGTYRPVDSGVSSAA